MALADNLSIVFDKTSQGESQEGTWQQEYICSSPIPMELTNFLRPIICVRVQTH